MAGARDRAAACSRVGAFVGVVAALVLAVGRLDGGFEVGAVLVVGQRVVLSGRDNDVIG